MCTLGEFSIIMLHPDVKDTICSLCVRLLLGRRLGRLDRRRTAVLRDARLTLRHARLKFLDDLLETRRGFACAGDGLR